ncbi:NADPH:quinone reductase [Micromonospora sediminicola]|uniref:NADPH:quinone reductase n=1 Tax=Micromonospora sediminicola TaxID=946078 RepID=A0A1A9B8J3_9ACTN|nr:NADP-dependent oxidoreductase [Micromonospora sediminicola]SBT65845.1 NADPH:quinone reductase [Micromonospora sediminicola]
MSRDEQLRSMRAVAFDEFGGPEVLTARTLPIPQIADDEILLKVWTAGVGVWDVMERQGQLVPEGATFPIVPGSDAAGSVTAVGATVDDLSVGDAVYAYAFSRPKGGFYAEYAAVKAEYVTRVPENVPIEHVGAMPTDALTALAGLDALDLPAGATVLVFGASGGQGHLAVQLAKRLGLRVVAIASGDEGVRLVSRLGADVVLDGHDAATPTRAGEAVPGGVDGLLAMANGPMLARLGDLLKPDGTLAYPHGVQPEPTAPAGRGARAYDGITGPDQLRRLNHLIESGPFEIHVAETFPLAEAAQAHRRLQAPYLGKLLLRVH